MTQDSKGQKGKPVRALKPGSSGPASRRELRREAYLAKRRAVDWSKPDVELAEEMGYRSGSSIGANRRRVGAPKSPRWHQYRSKFKEPNRAKWRSWDWSKQNAELARETGLTKERIRQIRQLLGAPESPNYRKDLSRLRRNTIALQWAAKNLDRLKGLSGPEVRRKYGFKQRCPVYEFLKAKGVLRDGRLFPKHRWDLMNFELPSGVLGRIWKLPFTATAGYRWKKRLGAPKWTLFGGLAALQKRGELRAYNRAVTAEERKAAKCFAESGRL
jgi:hypothetical protein